MEREAFRFIRFLLTAEESIHHESTEDTEEMLAGGLQFFLDKSLSRVGVLFYNHSVLAFMRKLYLSRAGGFVVGAQA